MKNTSAWVYFSLIRLLLFVIPFVVLMVSGIEWWLSALLAAIMGACVSYIFFRRFRERLSETLYTYINRQDSDGDAETNGYEDSSSASKMQTQHPSPAHK